MEDNIKQALLDGSATIQTKIEILPSSNEEIITLTEKNGVVSWDYEDFRYVADEGFIGQFVARQVNGVVKNISEDLVLTNKEFVLQLGVNTPLPYDRMYVSNDENGKYYVYGKSTQETRSGKNKLPVLPYTNFSSNGITSSFDGETFTLNGTLSSSWFDISTNFETYLPVGRYLLSYVDSTLKRIVLAVTYEDNTTGAFYLTNEKLVITTTKSVKKMRLFTDGQTNGSSINMTITGLMLESMESGSTPTEWEQYGTSPSPDYPSEIINKYDANTYQTHLGKDNYYLTLENDLSSISDVSNDLIIDKTTGTFEFTKRIGKVILDGVNIGVSVRREVANSKYGFAFNFDNAKRGTATEYVEFYCNRLLSKIRDAVYNNAEGISPANTANDYYGTGCFVYIEECSQMSVVEMNTWLQNNPLEVYYQLAEPETITGIIIPKEYDTTWYSLGNFLVNKITNDDVEEKITFEALDYTKKFNQPYVDTITYPCTALELAQNVCQQCGCELGNTDFKHNDWEITANVFQGGESCRDVLKAIGKLAYSWVRVDWDNKVYIDFSVETTTDEYNKLNNSNYYTLKTQKDKVGAINRVVIGYKDIEGEKTKVEDAESIELNGVNEITIYDNPLVYSQELREKAIIGAEDLFGLEYIPMEVLTVGHPWLKGKELLEVTDMKGNTYKSIPLDRTIQYFGHIKTLINVGSSTKTNTEYAYDAGLANRVNKTEVKVDKATQEVSIVVEQQEQTNQRINETIISVDETKQTISNVETKLNNEYYNTEQIDTMNSTTEESLVEIRNQMETTATANGLQISIIEQQLADGVTKVDTKTGYVLDENGLKIEKSDSEMNSLLDHDGLVVKRDEEEVLTVRSSGVETENLKVRTYFTIGTNTRVEDYKGGTGFFYIGGAE